MYRYLLRRHLQPTFAGRSLAGITEADVRRWRVDLLAAGVTPVTTAKAYRLLKAIMATTAEDNAIRRNPCRVKGASTEKSPERPTVTVPHVYQLADAAGDRYRALILLACFAGLRWGELAALRRADLDIGSGLLHVRRQLVEVAGRPPFFADVKSDAGRRTVAIPPVILADLTGHLDRHVAPEADALLFTSPTGKALRHGNFRRRNWLPALAAVRLDVHLHDLRHTGNVLVAEAGANLRELMERLGHSTTRAALIYLHSTSDRHHALADTVAARIRTELDRNQPTGR